MTITIEVEPCSTAAHMVTAFLAKHEIPFTTTNDSAHNYDWLGSEDRAHIYNLWVSDSPSANNKGEAVKLVIKRAVEHGIKISSSRAYDIILQFCL